MHPVARKGGALWAARTADGGALSGAAGFLVSDVDSQWASTTESLSEVDDRCRFLIYLLGTNAGAPFSFTKNTTNFAGLVLLALRPTT